MILDVISSPVKMKRYRAIVKKHNGDIINIDFGLRDGHTYIDNRNSEERANYWKRHLGNKIEKQLIENLVASPATLSAFLLWGPTRSLQTNINKLNKLWK